MRMNIQRKFEITIHDTNEDHNNINILENTKITIWLKRELRPMHGRVEGQAAQEALLIRQQRFLLQLHWSSPVHGVMQLVSRNRPSPSRNRTGTDVPDILVRGRFGQNRVLPKRILVRSSSLRGASEQKKILQPPLSVPFPERNRRQKWGVRNTLRGFAAVTFVSQREGRRGNGKWWSSFLA